MPYADFIPWMREHVERSIARWHSCAGQQVLAPRNFSRPEQRKREAAYDHAIREVEHELKTQPRSRSERLALQDRLIAAFGRFATTALGLEEDAVRMITDDFIPAGMEFARWTRRFDPSM